MATVAPFTNQQYITAALAVVLATVLLTVWLRSSSESELPDSPVPVDATTREACDSLIAEFPEISIHQAAGLQKFRRSYWAAQAQSPQPALVLRPRDSNEVSKIVKALGKLIKNAPASEPVRFAIRSGGHSPNRAFASVDAGIVLDLGLLANVSLSHDKKIANIGPGATWGQVYRKLQPHGLAVAGGRASSVGVGGLTLGGGLSFFSPRFGFVCDTVVSFEVVLADGSIVTANESSNRDLAVALRGGGNNFGIVTKFSARTFPQTRVWMGYLFHRPSAADRLFQAFYDFCKGEGYDRKATCMYILSWATWLPFYLPISCLNYTEPVEEPPALRGFWNEKRFWSTLDTRALALATDVVESMSPAHKQDLFHTTTFENDLDVLQEAHAAFKDSLARIKKVSGMVWSIVFQPLVPSATLHHASNAMGIVTDKTLIVMHVSVVHNLAKDAEIVFNAADELVQRVETFAKKRGVYHPYKYANYCSAGQNPYLGYGSERLKFLRDVSRKYDPEGVFQTAVPGGHEVFAD